MFPAPFGANPFGGDSGPQVMLDVIRRLQGSGYASDPNSIRMLELYATAYAAALGNVALERAAAQAFVDLTTELLEEWEHEFALPNDFARTILERQTRLVGVERAGAGASSANVLAALARVSSSAALLANTLTMISQDGVDLDLIFQVAVQLSTTEYDDDKTFEAVAQLLRRLMPARYGQDGYADSADVIIGELSSGAKWASTGQQLDRDALRQQTATSYPHVRPPARLRSYGPLSKLRSRDLNELQDALLYGPVNGVDSGLTSFPSTAIGADMVTFSLNMTAATTFTIDTSVQWKDRFLVVRGRVSAASKKITPGDSDQGEFNTSTEVNALIYTGDGSAAYDYNLTADVILKFDSGELQIRNNHGSSQFSVGLMVIASADLGKYA